MKRLRAVVLLCGALGWGCSLPAPDGPVVGAEAPAYGGTSLAGDSLSLADLRGQVVLLNLWATWCAPCRSETPLLQSIFDERKGDGFTIVGISMDTGDARDQVADFVGEYAVTYPILLDPQMRGMDIYRVLGLPASFLIDRDGVLRWMRIGPIADNDPDFLGALESTLR